MSLSTPISAAFIAFAAAIIGGLLQSFNQTRLAKNEYLRRQKADAYLHYFKGVSALAYAKSDAEVANAHSVVVEARARVALYGAGEVLDKMCAAFRCGPIRYEDMAIHAAMIKAMRADASRLSDLISDESAFEIIYGDRDRWK